MKIVSEKIAGLSLAAFSIMWFAALCVVAISTHRAFVFADEAGYLLPILFGIDPSNYAKWSILGAYPSYLYFWIYSLLPVGEIHTNAKLLNSAFIAATAFPAYVLARRYLTAPYAAAFAAILIISPISSFVRYVMPEAVYFFGFWLTVWIVLSSAGRSALFSAIIGGGLIGLLSLIKPHAFAISLALSAFFLIRARFRVSGVIASVGQFITYYAAHIFVKWLLTGVWSWSVIGSAYGGILSAPHIDFSASAFNFMGHIFALLVLIAFPLEMIVLFLFRNMWIDSRSTLIFEKNKLYDLGLLAGCLLAAMVTMTVYFSQSAYQIAPLSEKITRLHGRYYLYVLPLFWLFLVGLWRSGLHEENRPVLIRNLYVGGICILIAACVVGFAYNVGRSRLLRPNPLSSLESANSFRCDVINWNFSSFTVRSGFVRDIKAHRRSSHVVDFRCRSNNDNAVERGLWAQLIFMVGPSTQPL